MLCGLLFVTALLSISDCKFIEASVETALAFDGVGAGAFRPLREWAGPLTIAKARSRFSGTANGLER